jgi:hypothetical protein
VAKNIARLICLIMTVCMLFGCVNASVNREYRVTPNGKNTVEAKRVAKKSAIGGTILGGSVALWYGIMEGCTLGSTVAGTVICATAGGLVFGLGGLVIGKVLEKRIS